MRIRLWIGANLVSSRTKIIVFALCVVVLIALCALYPQSAPRTLSKKAQILKSTLESHAQIGDLIFRKGVNSESMIIANLSDSPFSHIGIVANVAPLRIIHATTDDNPNAQNQVIESAIDEFLLQARIVGLKRLPLPQNVRESIAKNAKLSLGAPFTLNTSDDSLYCTTFVRNNIVAVAPKDFSQNFMQNLPYKRVDFALIGGKYLFPSAFWEHSDLEMILDISAVD